jgi:hypothetical protein
MESLFIEEVFNLNPKCAACLWVEAYQAEKERKWKYSASEYEVIFVKKI